MSDPWIIRVLREFDAGNLTRTMRDVLIKLRGFGQSCFPSHAAIAARARCSTKTVQRALRQAEHLGLIRAYARYRRDGWRVVRTSNRYLLTVPAWPASSGQRVRGVDSMVIKKLPDWLQSLQGSEQEALKGVGGCQGRSCAQA